MAAAVQAKELPHNHAAIVEMAELHEVEDLHEHFRNGVFLHNNTVRFWTDPSSNNNSFILYARSLDITGSTDSNVWRWPWLDHDIDVEVAEMLDMSPLEVKGKFEMNHFTPKVKYEVLFVILVKKINPSGLEPDVTLTLELPNGKKTEKTVSLKNIEGNEWEEVKAGEFVGTAAEGDIKFSMVNHDDNAEWKEGLIVEGVLIQPCV